MGAGARVEAFAMVLWVDAEPTQKCAPQAFAGAKATGARHGIDRMRALFQPAACGLNAQRLDKPRWCDLDFGLEHPREMARTHRHASSQRSASVASAMPLG